MTDQDGAEDRTADRDSEDRIEPTDEGLSRRSVAKLLSGAAGTAAIGSFGVAYLTGLPGDLAAGDGTLYVEGTKLVDGDGNTLAAADALPADESGSLTVFPQQEGGGALKTNRAATLLVRYAPDDYQEPTDLDGTVRGYAAYSKVCTHEGCIVNAPENGTIHCPCHGSKYDPLKGAEVTGGPAPRALPQLPLGIADDEQGTLIVATGPFEGPVGPEG
ncbi:MAG: ubiquinol-cytochrome c reductase iron-sulfur subunit [Haloarculaceae archaeon]